MTEVRFKYLHGFRDRHGHARYYFRYRGQRWSTPGPGEAGFAAEYERLLAHIKTSPVPAPRNVAFLCGSLGWTIEKFMASSAYAERAETTKRNYRRVLDILRERYGAGQLKDLKARHVKIIRNEIRDLSTTTAADIAVGLISTLWDFADEELNIQLDADPTHGIRRVHVGSREHEPWLQELIDRFMREAKPSLGFAVRLAFSTGLRRSDLVRLRWDDLRADIIELHQQKTGEPVVIGCTEELRAELASMPRRGDTIIVGERGGALTAQSLSVMVRRELQKMGVTGYSIHGLRKNAGNDLAEADGTEREIMARLGHQSPQMAAHYTKRASRRKLARSTVEKLERAKARG
jgi:integrase